MAARATRSASHTARATEAVVTGPLGALSHDELGVIVDGLADPLQPVVAVALSSTCLGLRTPLEAALEVLNQQHERAAALCQKMGMSCVELVILDELEPHLTISLTAEDMATLGMCLAKLPRLRDLSLTHSTLSDAGIQALCGNLDHGALPSIVILCLSASECGPVGAEALAAALGRGAMPKLRDLYFYDNAIGNRGLTALAIPLRKLPFLRKVSIFNCEIGDDGVASLVADLGKDDFRALERLFVHSNPITDAGAAKFLAALDAGGLPKLNSSGQQPINPDNHSFFDHCNVSASAERAVDDALKKRVGRGVGV